MSIDENVIVLQGDFNAPMVKFFKEALRRQPKNESIVCRIDSLGGNGHSMNFMSGHMAVMTKYHKSRFISQIVVAESAALIFAVNMHERHVTKSSVGSIHLPVRNMNVIVGAHEPNLEIKNKSVIDHFVSRTKLTAKEVISLEGKFLSAEEMLYYGIATKLVESFQI